MTRTLTTTPICFRSGSGNNRACLDPPLSVAAKRLPLPEGETCATHPLPVFREAWRNKTNDGHHDRMVIQVSLLLLARLEARRVDKYNILRTFAKKAVAGGDVLFLPALNLLNLIGLIDYRPETDVVEYVGSGQTD
jgi:hypothetical protein